MEGDRQEIASRLTQLVNLPEFCVSPDDRWMPYGIPILRDGEWDTAPSREAILCKSNDLVEPSIRRSLRNWWLAVPKGANAPNWDISSTCRIRSEPGLLLVEAKAHANELAGEGKSCPTSENGRRNHERIGIATTQATSGLHLQTGRRWDLSRDHHYQVSNRFAWSWKLASLGIPVVLVYLGFLNACEMADVGSPFRSEEEWIRILKNHTRSALDDECWGEPLDIAGVALIPLIRAYDQPFGCC